MKIFKKIILIIISTFSLAFANSPQASSLLDYALALQKEGSTDKALHIYENILNKGEPFLEIKEAIFYQMGDIYFTKKNYDQSINFNIKTLNINPKNIHAHYALAVSYEQKKLFKKAINAYQKVIEIDQNVSVAYMAIGNILYNHQEYKSAVDYYKKSIQTNPKNDEAYTILGVISYIYKDFEQAIDYSVQALKINPNNPSNYTNLFELQLVQNKPFNPELEKAYHQNFKKNLSSYIHYDMLKMLKEISQGKKVNLNLWTKKYQAISMGSWRFKELEDWVTNYKNKNIRTELIKALKIFKNHQVVN